MSTVMIDGNEFLFTEVYSYMSFDMSLEENHTLFAVLKALPPFKAKQVLVDEYLRRHPDLKVELLAIYARRNERKVA
jgi:hypothetical protein